MQVRNLSKDCGNKYKSFNKDKKKTLSANMFFMHEKLSSQFAGAVCTRS